jgi:two-component system phosphate regulon sensor histidine kinase PhoR
VRWLTRSVRVRVGLAALAGVASGIFVLALLAPSGGALLLAGVVAGIVTVAAAGLVARSVSVPLERLAERSDQDRRAAEEALRTAGADRDRLVALVDELGEAIVIAAADGRIERANRAAVALLGEAAAGRPLVEVVRDHELLGAIASARAGRETVVEIERTDPPRFQRALARRLAGDRLLLVIQDLTALRRLETVRSDFVANVSHELRTPIASLQAMAETLESGALDDREAAMDFVRRMRDETVGLAALVEELLLISRLESGQQILTLAPVSPAALLAAAAGRLAPLAERAGLRLVVEPAEHLPAVSADRDRISQVFANLIHNATKHTPAGGAIHLSATRGNGSVAFSVRDTGEGVAESELARIFERFYKADRSRADGGSGLGLSIAKHIVEAHGGTIAATSGGLGRGATFTFTLPTSTDAR